MARQGDWRFCTRCYAMFFDGYEEKGSCPVGGGHIAQGLYFDLPFKVASNSNWQPKWRFCNKCFALHYDGYDTKGHCAAGGGHVAQGYLFVMPHDTDLDESSQSEWRYCVDCGVMFYEGYRHKPGPQGRSTGRCAAHDGGHNSAGHVFVIPLDHSHDNDAPEVELDTIHELHGRGGG